MKIIPVWSKIVLYFAIFFQISSCQEHENYLEYDEDYYLNQHNFYETDDQDENFHAYERTISLDGIGQKIDGKLAALLDKSSFKLGLFNDLLSAVNNTLGVDIIEVLDELLSLEGVVSQFALSLVIQVIFVVGYTISGIIYFLSVENTSGATQEAIKELDFLFNTGSIVRTLVRSLIGVVWELGARIFTTFILFGVFETVNQVIATTSISGLWELMTSTDLKRIMIGRFLAATAFAIIGFVLLNELGMAPANNLAIAREAKANQWPLIAS